MRPVQDVSGLQMVLNSNLVDERISLAATAAAVQANTTNTDRALFKVRFHW